MDEYRIGQMIRAAIAGNKLTQLQTVAQQQNDDAETVLCRFLTGSDETLDPSHVLSEESYDDLKELCRNLAQDDWDNLEQRARIGMWPHGVPVNGNWDPIAPKLNEIAWAWCWAQDEKAISTFTSGGMIYWYPGSISSNQDVAEGFIQAIKHGLISIPRESWLYVVWKFFEWTRGVSNYTAGPEFLCLTLVEEASFVVWTDEELQVLAQFIGEAAAELGRRGVRLAIPMNQCQSEWVRGVIKSVPTGTLEDDAVRYQQETNPVVRCALSGAHEGCDDKPETLAENPGNPFDAPISRFWLLAGMPDKTPLPTFEECLAYLDRQA